LKTRSKQSKTAACHAIYTDWFHGFEDRLWKESVSSLQ